MLRLPAAGALALAGMLACAASANAELKLGVVDIVKVMNNYERTKDASTELQVEQAKLKATSEPRIQKIEDLRNQRDGFNKGKEEWKRLDTEALKAEIQLRTELAFEQAQIEGRHQEILLDMYREIRQAVAAAAKAGGLDLVFTKAFLDPPQIELEQARGLEDLKARIVGQRLIFPADSTDVTDEVIKRLNDQYKATKTAAPAAPKG